MTNTTSTPQSGSPNPSIQEADSNSEGTPKQSPAQSPKLQKRALGKSLFAGGTKGGEIQEVSSREGSDGDSNSRNGAGDDNDSEEGGFSIMDRLKKNKIQSLKVRPTPNNPGDSPSAIGSRFRGPRSQTENLAGTESQEGQSTPVASTMNEVKHEGSGSPPSNPDVDTKSKTTVKKSLFGDKFMKAQQAEEALKQSLQSSDKPISLDIVNKSIAGKMESPKLEPSAIRSPGGEVKAQAAVEFRKLRPDNIQNLTVVTQQPKSNYFNALLSKSGNKEPEKASPSKEKEVSPSKPFLKKIDMSLLVGHSPQQQRNNELVVKGPETVGEKSPASKLALIPPRRGGHNMTSLTPCHHDNAETAKSKKDEFRKSRGLALAVAPIKTSMKVFMALDDLTVKKTSDSKHKEISPNISDKSIGFSFIFQH